MEWDQRTQTRERRLERARPLASGKLIPAADARMLLEALLEPGDRVCLEGDNQKQASFLAANLAALEPAKVHDLHLVMSTVALDDHLRVFERGIARRLDFAYSGPQAVALARLVAEGKVEVGAIHTYLELYGRFCMDLTPRVALVCAEQADGAGNLFTGGNTEDTPVIVETTAFRGGIVVAQVNQVVERLPRVDIPGDWIDFVVESPTPYHLEPLFTRDPARIDDTGVLLGMLALAGVYAPYGVRRLNHGIGYATAAIELLLPIHGAELGLKGKICRHWALNPHPTMIPAIESGWVESIHCFGSEVGMEDYVRARPDVFFTGRDGSLRSNRCLAQLAGLYATDLFIGSTLQMDPNGNSSTATKGRITGFGGAPNLGSDARGRRHATETWVRAGARGRARNGLSKPARGRKLVAQIVRTIQPGGQPTFVEMLDAFDPALAALNSGMPPIMIHGDDVTHVVTEEGVADLLRCDGPEEREQAIRGVAGETAVGRARSLAIVENLRDKGAIRRPEDLGIRAADATTERLAARSLEDLVRWSGGLYRPPAKFAKLTKT